MLNKLTIRLLNQEDPPVMSAAFDQIGWNKPISQYQRYVQEQTAGKRVIWVAWIHQEFAGYVTINWFADYPFFKEHNIPEIQDFNVLPRFRRQGIGTKLMDKAEDSIAERSSVAGIGVGLYDGYNAAQRLYVLRGYVPDGNGVFSQDKPLHYGDIITVDDSLILYFTKQLGSR